MAAIAIEKRKSHESISWRGVSAINGEARLSAAQKAATAKMSWRQQAKGVAKTAMKQRRNSKWQQHRKISAAEAWREAWRWRGVSSEISGAASAKASWRNINGGNRKKVSIEEKLQQSVSMALIEKRK
jgi:hypothetical protein